MSGSATKRQSTRLVGPAALGANNPGHPVAPECLADLLVGRPGLAAGSWERQADARKPGFTAEVGDLEGGYAEAPEIAWELPKRWESTFSEVAVPLRPERVLVAGEAERVED